MSAPRIWFNSNRHTRGSQNVGHAPSPRRALLVLWGASFLYEGIFIFSEIWAQNKVYLLVGTLLGLNVKLDLFYTLNFTKVYLLT
jgi:hypothetical protein